MLENLIILKLFHSLLKLCFLVIQQLLLVLGIHSKEQELYVNPVCCIEAVITLY